MVDVTILGGGVIGLSIADELARAGASVRLLDRGQFGMEASWAGAGMLPPGNLSSASTAESALRGLSHQLWPHLVAWLQAQTGIDSGYRMSGAVRLFDNSADCEREAAAWRAEQVPVESLTPAMLAELEPAIVGHNGVALYLPSQAQVRNPRHLRALIASCAAQGVELMPNIAASAWELDGDRIRGVRTPQGTYRSDYYCLAAGAWSAALLEPLGVELSIRPIRGQIVLLNAIPLPFRRMIELGPRYLVPRPDGRVLVGATEEQAGFEKCNTAAAIAELLTMAIGLCPALSKVAIERSWAGLRPGSPQGLPYIGQVPGLRNLFVAAGHFRSGLQMSPGTARLMRQIILRQPTDIPVEPFAPSTARSEDLLPERNNALPLAP